MNKYLAILILFLLFIACPTRSQTQITGRVTDEKGQGIPNANILIVKEFNQPTIIAYTLSDDNGNYTIMSRVSQDSLNIIVKGFNLRTIQCRIPNRSGTQNFIAKEEAIQLKEVTVKSKRIWETKDTINYLVSSFSGKSDVSIGDVLKKMPGIHVNPSGSIEYQGMPINKFYIEGLDLLNNRYGIATNNISPNDIATVQVLEHHQPIRALEKVQYSDRSAINLKLKDSAKGLFSLIAQLGVGYDDNPLGEGELFGSYFTRKQQHIGIYKGNNNGDDIEKEIRDHNSDTSNDWLTNLLMPIPPSINKSQYYNNQSHLLSNNNIVKTKKGNERNIGFFYFNDNEERNSYSRTSYLLPDGRMNVINELLASSISTKRVAGEAKYQANQENTYLVESFKGQAEWLDGYSDVASENLVNQRANYRTINITNDLHWIVKKDEYSGWDFCSTLQFKNTPQELLVTPNMFPDLFEQQTAGLRQEVDFTHFETQNSAGMLTAIMLGKVRISPMMIANATFDNIVSQLRTMPNEKVEMVNKQDNNTNFQEIKVGISATATYSSDFFHFHFNLPVLYNHRALRQKLQDYQQTTGKYLFEPSIQLNFNGKRWDWGLNFLILNSHAGIGQLYSGYILNDYRNISMYAPDLNDNQMHRMGLKINYKNIFELFFASLKASYSRYTANRLYGQTFDGSVSQIISQEANTFGDIAQIGLGFSKGFDWKKTNIELQTQWTRNDSPILRQEQRIRNISDVWIVDGKLNIIPFSFLSFSLSESWNKNWNRQKRGRRFPTLSTLTTQARMEILLPGDWSAMLSFYNYYNNQSQGKKSFSLADMEIRYKWKTTLFSLEWNNLFDTKSYTYSSLNELSQYYSEYIIRPSAIQFKVRFKIW